ncbi:MAG TPA: biotin--[acetyl-CoA-carboxylase] ligase, partial [Gaiellaceae bacterium]|nr:biotin--[acetyl-CoA-carboxylase] ligase [Gaiellaceae bacterium]
MLDSAQPEGAVAVCEEQTAGRGRMGRAWEAPAGSSILMSLLLRPPAGRPAAELSLVAGVATALAVEHGTGLAAQIKWPNDVMLDRRKVAGVLAELKDGAVVLGIGLNVNQGRDELPTG